MFKTLPLILFLNLAIFQLAFAQGPPCGSATDEPPGCTLCGPVYFGSTAPFNPGTPGPTFPCGTIENNQWLSIVAGSTNMSATIVATDCQNNQGVQLLIYDTNLNPVSSCFSSGGNNIPGNVQASGLTPGEVYWIMIDGFAGDICEFTITVTGGVNTGPPDPPGPISMIPNVQPLCPGAIVNFTLAPVNGASEYEWTVPGNAVILSGQGTNEITVEFTGPGGGAVCVTPSNPCFPGIPTCFPVVVTPLPPTIRPPDFFCAEDFPVVIAGKRFDRPGFYNETFESYLGCDSTVQFSIFEYIIPPNIKPPQFFCREDYPVMIDGNRFQEAGTYEIVYTSANGCDSSVTYLLFEHPQIPGIIDTVLCPDECIQVGFDFFCEEGSFETTLRDADVNGCDSLVKIFIEYLEPEATIAPPDQLGCGVNVNVTLDGNGSSTGQNVTYQWTGYNGGTIVGSSTNITADAGTPGNYVLTVTLVENGKVCTAADTVMVSRNAAVPPQPVFASAITEVCEGGMATYSINPVPGADSYTWTVPDSASFTGGGTSITVTWPDTQSSSQVCVVATNDCGDSDPACVDVTVYPIPSADFSVVSPICVDSATTVLYTGNAGPNAQFTWSFSGGSPATVTGPGPHTIQWPTAGTKTIRLSVEDNICLSDENSMDVQVDAPLPMPVINCNSTINSVNFTWNSVPGANDYSISINGVDQGTQTGTSFLVDNLAPNDVINIEVTANGNSACGPSVGTGSCQAQNCPPVNLAIDTIANICRDAGTQPLQLGFTQSGGAGGGTGTWSGPGTSSDGMFDPNSANIGLNTITLTYVEGNCTYNASTNISVFDPPSADFTVESPICETEGSRIVYTGNASSGATYSWDFDTGTVTNGGTGDGPYDIEWSGNGNYNVQLEVEENGCTSGLNQQAVQVDAVLPDPVISCISTTNSVSLSWSDVPGADSLVVNLLSGAAGTIDSNSYNVTGLVPGDEVIIEVVALGATVCGPSRDTLNCIAASCPPIDLQIDTVPPICKDGNQPLIQLSATVNNGTGMGSYTWSGPGVSPDGQFDPNDPAVVGGGPTRVRLEYIEDNCVFNASRNIQINGKPSANFTAESPICIDQTATVQYVGTPPANATFIWSTSGGTPANLSGPGPHEINWITRGTKRLSLLVTANNCPSDTARNTTIVDTLLEPPVITCTSTTSSIQFNWDPVPGAIDYQVNVLAGTSGNPSGATQYNVGNLNVGDPVTIEVVASGNTVCGPSRDTLECFAKPCPPIDLVLDPVDDICLYPNTMQQDLNANLTITGSNGNESVSWSGGNYVTLGGSFFPFSAGPGTHRVLVTVTEEGCTFRDSMDITIFGIPNASFIINPRICLTDSAWIQFNGVAGQGSNFFWDFGNGNDVVGGTGAGPYAIQWNDSGRDSIQLFIESNGCYSDTVQASVLIDEPIPAFPINCESTATGITFSWDPVPGASGYQVTVEDAPGGATTNQPDNRTIEVNGLIPLDEVTITVTAIDSLSTCPPTSVTETCVAENCPPIDITFDPTPSICLDATAIPVDISGSVSLSGNLTTNGTRNWSGPGMTSVGIFDPNQAGVGTHTITFSYSELGCDYSATTTLVVNDLPVADAGPDQLITCFDSIVPLGGPGNDDNPFNAIYSWAGGTVGQSNAASTQTTEAGTFTLTVEDPNTGCINTDEVEVSVSNNQPELDASVVDITCFGYQNGEIRVNGVNGGTSPFLYSFNGGAFTRQTYWNSLGPGTYSVRVQDANGCEDEITFVITEPEELVVELVVILDEYPIPLGDSVELQAIVNYAPELLADVEWSPLDQFPNCDETNISNCLSFFVTPTGQTVYRVRVTNTNGCAAADDIQLNVKKQRPVYIPSAFSPNNNDGVNDIFRIFGDPNIVANVKSFLIFDRWGELVFENYNFQPQDDTHGWDGTFRGSELNPGVFVYYAEIEFFDGVVEIFKGDVTLK